MQKKKNIYKKSRYYRERQKKLRLILMAATGVLLLILLLLLFRGCRKASTKTANSENIVKTENQSSNDTVSINSEISQNAGDSTNSEPVADSGTPSASDNSADTDNSEASHSSTFTPVTLTVSVVGDCTLGTNENFDYSTSLNAYFENYGKEYFFQNVKSIFEADDLTIANNEGTFTESYDREDKTFAFKAPASFAGIYSCSSVEAVNTANNHSHDYGEQSFSDTMNALDAEGIVHFGYDETAVMDVNGIKVGLVGIYELYDHLDREQQLTRQYSKGQG